MTLKGFLIILIFLIICAIGVFFISKKYPPELPRLTTFVPVERIDIHLETGRMYCFDNVRYIRDDKFLKVYPADEKEIIFPVEKIVAIEIKKGGSGE